MSAGKPQAVAKAGDPLDDPTAFIDRLSRSVDSGDLTIRTELTAGALMDYARRIYHVNPDASASCLPACGHDELTENVRE